jgi:hypothetical protein
MNDRENSMAQHKDNEDITVVRMACQCIVLGVVTTYVDADCQKEIDDLVAAGAGVEHMPATAFRSQDFGCECSPAQPTTEGTDDV